MTNFLIIVKSKANIIKNETLKFKSKAFLMRLFVEAL